MSARPGRTHRYLSAEPLFPFGFGLNSAAVAQYSGMRLSPMTISAAAPTANISVEVRLSAVAADGIAVHPARDQQQRQVEIVQVYFGWEGAGDGGAADREAGESSVPLHELKAFRRVLLPPPADEAGAGALTLVRFDIPARALWLMLPSGEMGLLPGKWRVWVGSTSPRTPPRLCRGGEEASAGAPQAPVSLELTATP